MLRRISIVFNLVQTMLDCRQNVLTSINTLIRRMTLFQSRPEEKHFSRFLSGLITEVELLRNDLVLVFNQNFYLRCKLDEKAQQLQATEKKLAEVTSHMELTLQMTRSKYEKQIQTLKFARFASKDLHEAFPLSESSAALSPAKPPLPSTRDEQQKNQQSVHHASTIKKAKQFCELRASSAGRELGVPPENTERKEGTGECEFDLELRGLMSEEQPHFSNNRLHLEMARSNEVEEQHSKKRRGKAVSSKKEEGNILAHRKKKSEELAELVAQQFKVQPIKEKYFSIDLL